MRVDRVDPPREFEVGRRGGRLRHVADVALGDDEVITLHGPSGSEVDVTRKSWGYYLTPSLNQRLREHGVRAVLTMGVPREDGEPPRMYVMGVEPGGEADFQAYLEAEEMRVVSWLDTDEAIVEAARRLSA